MLENKNIWVLTEHREGKLLDVTFEMLGDARRLADILKEEVIALVLGPEVLSDFGGPLAHYGADHVFYIGHPLLTTYRTDAVVVGLAKICSEHRPSNLIIPATPNGRDLAPRLAARLGVGLVTSCLRLQVGPDRVIEGTRETHEGRVYTTVTCLGARPHLFTFMPGAAGVGKKDKTKTASEKQLSVEIEQKGIKTKVIKTMKADPRAVDLIEADKIVAGGRGAGSREAFVLLEDLADAMNASVGGSRVAADLGWIPHDRMIGLSGKKIAPRLYLAAGISGGAYHAMGIKGSENIIAINTDRGAEIFKLAHLAVAGDFQTIVPILKDKIKKYLTDRQKKQDF